MESIKDKKLIEYVDNFILNNLVRPDDKKNYKKRFVGGMPITLEKNDVNQLLVKGDQDAYDYNITQKVDGTRMLMFIGGDYSEDGEKTKQRVVVFIDRKLNYFTVRDSIGSILPRVDTREMLLDGELLFFDSNGDSHKDLDYTLVKGVSFMTFDILYGPSSITSKTELGTKSTEFGQDSSMTVPLDGVLRTDPWTYIERYKILYNLIIPSTLNNENAMISGAFRGVNWFNVEIKPIYMLDAVKTFPSIYLPSGRGHIQKDLSSSRKAFYDIIQKKYGKSVNVFLRAPKLDGLIFTSNKTLYTIGTWNAPGTTQFKWKPTDEQTVDFMVKKTKKMIKGEHLIDLLIFNNKKLSQFSPNGQNATSLISAELFNNTKDSSIVEFSIINGRYIYKNERPDKDRPNALFTVLNVLNSIKSPVNINDLLLFLNIEKQNKRTLDTLLRYSTKSSLLNCISKSGVNVIPDKYIDEIQKQMEAYFRDPDIELEFRLGKINKGFKPNMTEKNYKNVIFSLSQSKWEKNTHDYVDIIGEKTRTRYLFSDDFSRYMVFENISKVRLSNVDFSLNNLLPFDIRMSTSTEKKSAETLSVGKALRKYRTSFIHPEKFFAVDITEIQSGTFINRTFKGSGDKSYQIEVEIKDPKAPVKIIVQFLTYIIGKAQ